MGLLDNPLIKMTGLDETRPMAALADMSAGRAAGMASTAPSGFKVGNVNVGMPSSLNVDTDKGMPDFSPPDVSSALSEGSSRAKSDLDAGHGPKMDGSGLPKDSDMMGFHPQLLQLARAMSPNSGGGGGEDDKNMALMRAGIGMADAGSHTGNFLQALSEGAGQGLDYFQKLRAYRAEMMMKQSQLSSENQLRGAQTDEAKAAAANYARQAFAGNFPMVMAMAKKSGQPQTMPGPMGTPITIMPDGRVIDGAGGAPGGAPNGAQPAGPALAQGAPVGMPPAAGGAPPSGTAVTAGAGAPPPAAPAGAAPSGGGQPYLPPGWTKDMYDNVAMFADMPGPMGDAARKQVSELAAMNPAYKGQVAAAEAKGKAATETVDVLSPDGTYTITVPKDKWLASQAKGTTVPEAGAAPLATDATGATPAPPHAMPKLNADTLGVKQVIPEAPAGGGYPVVPPNAKTASPGTAKMMEQGAEESKAWAGNAQNLDTQITRLRSLAQMYKLTKSNQWAEAQEEVASNLKQIYDELDLPFTVNPEKFGDPAAMQIAIKDATIQAFEQARKYTNRITNMELQGQTKTVANTSLQPSANFSIIMKGIALAERDQQMMKGWSQAQKQGWRNPLAYETEWYAANPVDAWVDSAVRRGGNFAGMPLPAKGDLNPQATYVLRDGRLAKWTGDGFKPVKKDYMNPGMPTYQSGD